MMFDDDFGSLYEDENSDLLDIWDKGEIPNFDSTPKVTKAIEAIFDVDSLLLHFSQLTTTIVQVTQIKTNRQIGLIEDKKFKPNPGVALLSNELYEIVRYMDK